MKNKNIAAIGGSVALSLVATAALAASGDMSATMTAQATVAVPIVVTSTTTAATTSITTTVTTGTDASTSSTGVNVSGSATGSTDSGSDVLDISASDAMSGDTSMSLSSPAQVSSSDDLNVYAKTLIRGDATIKSAYASDDEVSITYARPAKLLGFIPVKISEKAAITVDSQNAATASVHKSWWSFLATSANDDSFKAALDAQAKSVPAVSANASLSASARAQILAQIEAAAQASVAANS